MKLRALCVCSSMVVGWCCRFLGIMEAEIENENVLQYYTIIRGSDVVNEENDSQQNIIIYTVDAKNDTEDSYQEMLPEAEGTFEDCNQSVEIPNMKLVTLEDGSMFVTTGNYEFNENGSTDETKQVTYTEDIADENGEYREITLEDGSVTLVHVSVLNSLMQHADYQESPKSEKRYACPFKNCEKVYTSSHHLTVHIRNHTGARPYQCEVEGCEKAFATGYSLKAHLRTHTGEKPYGCLECNKHFKTSGDLHKHIRTHTGEKPFKCPIDGCGRSFTTSNIRKVHIRSHTGERPYSCSSPGCGKAFASATNFRNHVRIHTGEKPYVCPIETCGKRFTEYSSLYKHNAMHQSSKRVKCGICGHKYAHEATLDGHRKAAHPEFEEHELKILEDSGEIKFEFQEVRNTVGEYLDEKINGEIIDEFS